MKQDVKIKNHLLVGYVWNALASIAAGASSVLLLMVIKRCCGIEVGASFSIAVALSNLTINIGHLNMYGYQISDINENYSFIEYFSLRIYSVIAMILVSVIFILFRQYDKDKCLLILLYCVYRGFFAFFELYQARYQQKNRVDLSAKYSFFKVLIPDSILAIVVIIFSRIYIAIVMAIVGLIIYSFLFFRNNENVLFSLKFKLSQKIWPLFVKCIPVFYYAFVNSFILNSSKYVIDFFMDDKARFYYAILLLPATTIHMILGFIYRPLLTMFATLWDKGNVHELNKKVKRILACAVVILFGILILARPVLLPALELIYDVPDLNSYITPFIILLVAGGMQAVTTLYSFLITIIREQKHFIWIYTFVLIAALIFPISFVKRFMFIGATLSYLILSIIQVILVTVVFYLKERRDCRNE